MPLTRTLTLSLAAASANNIATTQTLVAAGNLTLNGSTVTSGVATLDKARRVLITSTNDDHLVNWTVTGTGDNGAVFSETLAGSNGSTSQTVHDFKTITRISADAALAGNVTVGTSSVGSTQPWVVDAWANPAEFGYVISVSGTVTYTIQSAVDDLSPQWDINNNSPTWVTAIDGSAGTALSGSLADKPCTMLRLTVNSGTGTVTAKFLQPFKAGKV